MNAVEYASQTRARQRLETPSESCSRKITGALETDQPNPVQDTPLPINPNKLGTLNLVEVLLKNRRGLHQLLRNHALHPVMLPRLLAISLAGFALFGVTMSLVLAASHRWPALTAIATWLDDPAARLVYFNTIDWQSLKSGTWIIGQALILTAAYAFGLVAASGIALPSLYFYCLLAGVRMTMLEVVVHAVKAKAIAAVALVGILPIYVALAMGVVIFDAGEILLRGTLMIGLILPFIAGCWGTISLYQGFAQLCDTMPPDRALKRECFLRRLVLSWSACYSAVMPVMIYSLWQVLSAA